MKLYYIYILTNFSRTVLYVGITNNPVRRIQEHIIDSLQAKDTFAGKYNCTYLLYYEDFRHIDDAIAREKQLKKWRRAKKLTLIKTVNPDMKFIELW